MEKLRNIEKLVYNILQEIVAARGDDYLLFYLVVREYFNANPQLGDIDRVPFAEIMCGHYHYGIPSYETVTRTRRRIQAELPELKTESVARRRRKEEQKFRAYARS